MVSKMRRALLWLGLLALALAACAPQQALAVGDPAPDFSLPDISGGQFHLADSTPGRDVLLYFSMADG
jgi:hypothetical protein